MASYPTPKFPMSKPVREYPGWSCPTLTRWSCRLLVAGASEFPGTSPGTTATRLTGLPIEAIAALGRRTIGERVRRYRESAGLTQEALARAAKIGRVTLVRLEKGEQSPRFKTLKAVAYALGDGRPRFVGRAGVLAPVIRRRS